jgi:tRNA-splicing ligase RtcB (3'-phosphate/5'-hydroxy nucleic acid ligase)
MYTIKNKKGLETVIYAETFEGEAHGQVVQLINSDAYCDSKVRIMPDAHAGKGCTIGTTMTIKDKITPNLTGVDIGCGMCTIQISNKDIDFKKLDNIIKKHIPSGFNIHNTKQSYFDFSNLRCKIHVDIERAMYSIGTLGGGNHFIELGKDNNDNNYLIIHSGSRKLGMDICKYYQDKINDKKVNHKEIINKLKSEGRESDIEKELTTIREQTSKHDIGYLSGQLFNDYMNDVNIAQQFANLNRETMANIIIREMNFDEVNRFQTIHNYIDMNRMILRKGAVSAESGETLLIPINMKDGSLLCIGKGNPDWNYSAPHGAGRLMSRSKAKESIKMEDFILSMKDVFTTSVVTSTLDEAPQAYKSINEIMNAIVDTVDIITVIKPLYNYKAH